MGVTSTVKQYSTSQLRYVCVTQKQLGEQINVTLPHGGHTYRVADRIVATL